MYKKLLGVVVLAAFLFASCASTSGDKEKSSDSEKLSKKDGTSKYLAALDEGRYDNAIKLLCKIKKDKKNQIRDNYDLAMLYHLTGDYQNSINLMGQTDQHG